MKIFISGSKTISKLKNEITAVLEILMNAGWDILIGDCMGADKVVQQFLNDNNYKNVTVYYSGEKPRNNVGNWQTKQIETNKNKHSFEYYREKDKAMINDCERALMLWDFNSKGTLANIFEMILNEKIALVYFEYNDRSAAFSSLEEFKSFLMDSTPYFDSNTQIPQNIYEELLDVFIPSKEMADYLKTQELSDWRILELICGAPVELTVKAEWLKKLSEYQNVFLDIADALEMSKDDIGHTVQYYINNSYYHCYLEIKKALQALNLKKGEQFYLKEKWYDTDDWLEKESGDAPCLSVKKAIELLIKENFDEDEDVKEAFDLYEECCNWAELEKWVLKNNDFIQTYNYYLLKDKICYFEEIVEENNYYCCKEFRYSHSAEHLNLPVPFVAGDIVKVDCTPFAPIREAVILEMRDQWDCCSVTAIYKNHEGLYFVGTLKHARLFEGDKADPLFSPLYRMEKCNTDDEVLKALSEYLNGDEQKGEDLWERLCKFYGMTAEQLLKILEEKE